MTPLASSVAEIEAIHAEEEALTARKRDAYNRAHKAGLNKTALCQVVMIRRQYGNDPVAFPHVDALVRQYLAELDEAGPAPRITPRGEKALTRARVGNEVAA